MLTKLQAVETIAMQAALYRGSLMDCERRLHQVLGVEHERDSEMSDAIMAYVRDNRGSARELVEMAEEVKA